MDEYNMSKDKRREKFSKHYPEKSTKRGVNQELKGWINVYEDTLRVW